MIIYYNLPDGNTGLQRYEIVIPINRTFLVRFGGISGEFGETQRAWYAAEAYQKGTIRYLPYPIQPKI